MARPTKYISGIHNVWAKGLAMDGYTIPEIAKRMNVAPSTINKWMVEIEEFSESIKKGREPADEIVKQSLYKRANGYSINETKQVLEVGKDGEKKVTRVETWKKEVAGDTTAQIFWLKNRRPDLWRDAKKLELENDSNIEQITGIEVK